MTTNDDMIERFEKVEHRLGDVENRLGAVEHKLQKVENRLGTVEHRLEKVEHKADDFANATKIQFERVHEDIKKLGEGYEDGLRQISKQIQDLDARWAEKWTPHDLALKNHRKRIAALEQQRRSNPSA